MSDQRQNLPHKGLYQVRLNPREIPARHQFEAWRQAIAPMYEVLPLKDTLSVETNITSYLLDELVVGMAQFTEHRSLRTRRHLANGETDYVSLQLYLRGSLRGNLGGVPRLSKSARYR